MGFLENDSIRQWDDEKQLEEKRRGEREDNLLLFVNRESEIKGEEL